MKSKKRKLLVLVLLVALVLCQSINVFASDITYDKTSCPQPQYNKTYTYNFILYSDDVYNDGRVWERYEYITIESDYRVCILRTGKHSSYEYLDYADIYCDGASVVSSSNKKVCVSEYQIDYVNGSVDDTETGSAMNFWKCWQWFNIDCLPDEEGHLEYALIYTDMPVFDNEALAQNYCQTGNMTGATIQPSKSYDLEGIYLEDFSVELHYSNYAKHIFWDFHYQIPESIEQAIAEGADCYIDLSGTYKIHTTSLSNSEAVWNIDEEIPISVVINLAEYPNGYSMNFDDVVDMEELENWFWGVGENTVNSAVTGSGSYGFNDYLCRTDTSRFDLTLIPSVNGVYGTGCSTSINLLNPKELSYWNSTPSDVSTGDYDMVSNLANSEGYYNTVVGYDNVGNPTYTYYYVNNSDNSVTNIEYKEDGSTEEVTSDGSINVTPTFSPTFNNNPTISPTIDINIEGDNLNNEVDNIVGEGTGTKEDNESFVEKFLGFFNVFKDNDFLNVFALLFAFLPTSVSDVIFTAIGIIAGIAVFKFFRK